MSLLTFSSSFAPGKNAAFTSLACLAWQMEEKVSWSPFLRTAKDLVWQPGWRPGQLQKLMENFYLVEAVHLKQEAVGLLPLAALPAQLGPGHPEVEPLRDLGVDPLDAGHCEPKHGALNPSSLLKAVPVL